MARGRLFEKSLPLIPPQKTFNGGTAKHNNGGTEHYEYLYINIPPLSILTVFCIYPIPLSKVFERGHRGKLSSESFPLILLLRKGTYYGKNVGGQVQERA